MKFKSSLAMPDVIQPSLNNLLLNSSHRFNPENVLDFDNFVDRISSFHRPSVNDALLKLTTNFNQPVYDFKELQAQVKHDVEVADLADSLSHDDEMSL